MSTLILSIRRTLVPALWGSLVGLLVVLGAVPAGTSDTHTVVTSLATFAGSAAVYLAGRWLEHQSWAPKRLVAILMGALRQPNYLASNVVAAAKLNQQIQQQVTQLQPPQAQTPAPPAPNGPPVVPSSQ